MPTRTRPRLVCGLVFRLVAEPVTSVALNGVFLAPGDSGGPETYLRELVKALAGEYPRLHLVLFTTGSGRRALASDGYAEIADLRALPTEEYRRVRRQLCEQLLLPLAARRSGAQLLHSLASTGPVRTLGLPSVVTLHDVTFLHMSTFGRVTTWGMKHVVTRAARSADALIAVSAAARDDICATLQLDRDRFTVTPHGMGPVPRAEPAAEASLRARLGLRQGRRIVLCVAALRPHKNQELLVRALPLLPEDVDVVLAGRQEPYAEEVTALAQELGLDARVHLTGFVDDAELERLWLLADCAVFPTRAEGFGLPLLEAMARGVPVACSDLAVLREVGGSIPKYFDPGDPRALAVAVQDAWSDDAAGHGGVERAQAFSWREAARGAMETYEKALAFARS
jgi:glycosyltransferase involved in cell wall biosynthesis